MSRVKSLAALAMLSALGPKDWHAHGQEILATADNPHQKHTSKSRPKRKHAKRKRKMEKQTRRAQRR